MLKMLEELYNNGGVPFLKGFSKNKIINITKGKRPNPEEYLPKDYIKKHLKKFEEEGIASRIISSEDYNDYGIGKPDLGKTEFVSSKSDIDQILKLSAKEQAIKLGKPIKQILKGELIRIDFKLSKDVRVEIPSGNEWATNKHWIPGGILPDKNLEAIIKTEGLKENMHYTIKNL